MFRNLLYEGSRILRRKMSITTKRLDNGITLLMEDIKSINTASLGFFVRAGAFLL